MEAFALPEATVITPMGESVIGSTALPPLVHKRQLSSTTGFPTKRRKLSEPVSPLSVGSPKSSSRPNMTASSSITLDMLRPHFEEPLAKVAASFGICVTLLKKICRRHGIARWPHRQITGLRKSIASMEHAIGYFDGARRESYAEQLLKQKNKLAALLEDPTTNNPLLAAEDDRRVELVKGQVKVPLVQSEVAPAMMTRASSPTGPLLVESPYYVPSSVAMPQTTPMWYPTACYAEPNSTQTYHQLCPPPKLEQTYPEVYPTNYFVPTGISSPTIYLPPLRQESRGVLPPISSLVLGNNINSASGW